MTVPFANAFDNWADDDLRAEINLSRRVIRDGEFCGVELDARTTDMWRDWLSDLESELSNRTKAAA